MVARRPWIFDNGTKTLHVIFKDRVEIYSTLSWGTPRPSDIADIMSFPPIMIAKI